MAAPCGSRRHRERLLVRPLKAVLVVGVLVTAACLVEAAGQRRVAPATVTLFEGARLISGDGGAPVENSAFVVTNSTFTWVGRRGERQLPAGAARIDLTGKTVIP